MDGGNHLPQRFERKISAGYGGLMERDRQGNSLLHIGRSVYVSQSETYMGVNDTSFVNQANFETNLVITMEGKGGGAIYSFGVRGANEARVIILGFVDGVVILWPTCECGEEGA